MIEEIKKDNDQTDQSNNDNVKEKKFFLDRKRISVLVIMLISIFVVGYFSFFKSKKPTPPVVNSISNDPNILITAPSAPPQIVSPTIQPPQLPTPPSINNMTIPTPTVQPTPQSSVPSVNNTVNTLNTPPTINNIDSKKLSTGFNVYSGSNANTSAKNQSNSQFLGFDGGVIDNSPLAASSATSVVATKVMSNLSHTILQGKVIDAVLETAINTQLAAGIIRAIISRDVYGEQGDQVLIPKGSRVVGNYNVSSSGPNNSGATAPGATTGSSGSSTPSSNGQVQTRVYVTWNRIITPSGVDLNITGTAGSDQLGRLGIPGYLDLMLIEQLSNSLLVSVLIPLAIANMTGTGDSQVTTNTTINGGGGIIPTPNSGGSSSSTTPGSSTTTQSSVDAQIVQQGSQQFATTAQQALSNAIPQVPTLYVDQGAKITILAQQDLIFPQAALK
jgi:type IV secretion system protein VirB10